jgi:uncharacterized protein DUF6491
MTLKVYRAAATLAVAIGLASCVQSQEARTQEARAGRQCFSTYRVTGFSEAGRDRLLVNVGLHDVYEFQTFSSCQELDFTNRLVLRTRTGSSQICDELDADLIVPRSFGPPELCRVRMIRKLTPQEVAARRH